jgi:hypothetical protein
MHRTTARVAWGGFALLFAACGSGGSSAEQVESDSAASPASETATAAPPPDEANRFRSSWPVTDFSNVTIDLTEVLSGGVGRDQIPPLDVPGTTSIESRLAGTATFVEASEAGYEENLPLVVVTVEGETRGYGLHILTWHEIVNDELGGVPIAVTFCPLCNTAIVFDRRVDGEVLDFGVSGLLRHSDLIMWDRQTESWWQQATGEGIAGRYGGEQLAFVGAGIVSFRDFQNSFPDALVLSEETGMGRSYGTNPYTGYDELGSRPFLFQGDIDERLPALERVVALRWEDGALAIPFPAITEAKVIEVAAGDIAVVVFWAPGTSSALDQGSIADSRDIGAAVAFEAVAAGQRLTFEAVDDGEFRDNETGSSWDITGVANSGPLAGERLTLFEHTNQFWFSWAAFFPETDVWDG